MARRGPLSKPVIAPYVIGAALQGIPVELRERQVAGQQTVEQIHVSGVPNLSYVNILTDFAREVLRFHEIVPFTRLTILIMQAFEAVPEVSETMLRELGPLGLEMSRVEVGDSLEEALAAIPSDTQAVYVTPLLQLPSGDFDRLVETLIQRRLPSFSLWGQSEV